MRQTIVFMIFLLMPLTIQAQEEREIIPVDWKEVKKVAEQDPQRIKDLVTRLSANQIDTTMTWQERILAFYGQSYLESNDDTGEGVMDLDKLMNEKKYEECLSAAKKVLNKNPLSLKALRHAAFSIGYMVKVERTSFLCDVGFRRIYVHAILSGPMGNIQAIRDRKLRHHRIERDKQILLPETDLL